MCRCVGAPGEKSHAGGVTFSVAYFSLLCARFSAACMTVRGGQVGGWVGEGEKPRWRRYIFGGLIFARCVRAFPLRA